MLDLNIGLPKNKKVIYTCITNNYDNLIEDEFYLEDYDYICFTNNENLKSNRWKIEKIPNTLSSLSPVRQARYIKTHPHIFLSNYELYDLEADKGTVKKGWFGIGYDGKTNAHLVKFIKALISANDNATDKKLDSP